MVAERASTTTRCGSCASRGSPASSSLAPEAADRRGGAGPRRQAARRRPGARLRRAAADRGRAARCSRAGADGRGGRAPSRAARARAPCTASSRAPTTTSTSTTTRWPCSTQPIELERDPSPLGEHAAAVRALLERAAGRRAVARRGACASARCCTTPPSRRRAASCPDGRVTFMRPRRGGCAARARRARAAAGQRAPAPATSPRSPATTCGSASSSTSGRSSRRALYRYLRACEPVEVDVTVLSVADRLATRGRKADEAIGSAPRARRGRCSARRWPGGPGPASRRWCAATSSRASSASSPGPQLGTAAGRGRRGALRGRGGARASEAVALARPARRTVNRNMVYGHP